MRQITRAIEHFHKNISIEHRDIKLTNLLISLDDIRPLIKLADFEFCCQIENTDDYELPCQDRNGTPGFMAPELYSEDYQQGKPFAIDIFAAACVFCVTFSGGEHPFGADSEMWKYNITEGLMDFKVFNWRSDQRFFKLIEPMLRESPRARPTATEVLNNAFLNELLEFCETTEDWNSPDVILRFDNLIQNESIDVNVRDEEDRTLLMLICLKNQTESLYDFIRYMFLRRGDADVNATDKYGNNILTLLCENYPHNNLIDILRLLIPLRNIDVNCTTTRDNSNALLLLCTTYNHDNLIDIIQLLIENRIIVDAVNSKLQNGMVSSERNVI